MMPSFFARVVLCLLVVLDGIQAFQVPTHSALSTITARRISSLAPLFSTLFDDDEDMIPVAKNYLQAKYREAAKKAGGEFCTKEQATEIMLTVLPPVTSDELEREVNAALSTIMKDPDDNTENIDEAKFVENVFQNSYWESAGSLVVKELIYLDALYNFYSTGKSLLNDDDYGLLKENLTWEGSAVATMNKKEALFVTAVASSRRGQPIMGDEEYISLKKDLKKENSWVTNREADALEKLGLDTFMGYLHRAM